MLNQDSTIRFMAERHKESMEAAEERFEKMKAATIRTDEMQPNIFHKIVGGLGSVVGAAAGGIARGFRAIFG